MLNYKRYIPFVKGKNTMFTPLTPTKKDDKMKAIERNEMNTNTNEYGTTIEHVRQDEINDVFKAIYKGMEAFYTFPRSMEVKAEDVHDFVKSEHFE